MPLIPGCDVSTLIPREKLIENIKYNSTKNYHPLVKSPWWRNQVPLAVIGGGPSLRNTWREILNFRYSLVCGSAHDFVRSLGISPTWCAVVDADPIVNKYMENIDSNTHYLIASQCSPETFEYLKEKRAKFSIWHADGDQLKEKAGTFGEGTAVVGGGCTVGTRAIVLGIGMGFFHQHLFGYDTCLTNDYKHHAYDFVEPDVESVGNIYEINLGDPNGPKYKVAEYMLAQIFDYQNLLKVFGNCLQLTVHGEGVLAALMAKANAEAALKLAEAQKDIKDGNV